MTLVRRFRSFVALLAGLLTATLVQSASLTPIVIIPQLPRVPLAPGLGQPAAGPQRVAMPNNVRPTFTWTQGGLVTTTPQPPVANYFMVCVYPVGGSCTWPGTWNAAAANIPRTEIVTLGGIRTGRYRYTFLASNALPNNLLDVDLMWNVGACTSQAQSSCNLGTARPVLFSTRNLVATDVEFDRSSDGTQGWIKADLIAENDGTRDSGAFTTGVFLVQVLTDGTTCITDPSAPGVQALDLAILADGTFVEVGSVAANAPIRGIFHAGFDGQEMTVQSNSLGAGIEFSVGSIESMFAWDANETARAYVGGGIVDNLPGEWPGGVSGTTSDPAAVKEFSESDNTRFECRMLFR